MLPRIVIGVPGSLLHRLVLHILLSFLARLRRIVIGGRLGQEIGRHQSSLAPQFTQIEAVVVHVTVHVDDVTRLKA